MKILEIVGEGDSVKYSQYDGWIMHIPEGTFKFTVGKGKFEPVIEKFGGENAIQEWNSLIEGLKSVTKLSGAIPPLALRSDISALITMAPHIPKLLAGTLFIVFFNTTSDYSCRVALPAVSQVEGSFKDISKHYIKDKFLENWFEFLSFALSGLPADGTIAAAVAYTMRDLHQDRAALDYPIGGSIAVINALIRAIEKRNGKLILNSHVDEILVENNKAYGVKLRKNGKIIRARRAVISNASIWDTTKLLTKGTLSVDEEQLKMNTPRTGSFVHLHIGIDAMGLPDDLESHYSVINSWDQIDAPQNHVIISIPSVLDPSLAPPNCHVIHAYAAANEV
jgi:phytoene dehydrogenase-like protein